MNFWYKFKIIFLNYWADFLDKIKNIFKILKQIWNCILTRFENCILYDINKNFLYSIWEFFEKVQIQLGYFFKYLYSYYNYTTIYISTCFSVIILFLCYNSKISSAIGFFALFRKRVGSNYDLDNPERRPRVRFGPEHPLWKNIGRQVRAKLEEKINRRKNSIIYFKNPPSYIKKETRSKYEWYVSADGKLGRRSINPYDDPHTAHLPDFLRKIVIREPRIDDVIVGHNPYIRPPKKVEPVVPLPEHLDPGPPVVPCELKDFLFENQSIWYHLNIYIKRFWNTFGERLLCWMGEVFLEKTFDYIPIYPKSFLVGFIFFIIYSISTLLYIKHLFRFGTLSHWWFEFRYSASVWWLFIASFSYLAVPVSSYLIKLYFKWFDKLTYIIETNFLSYIWIIPFILCLLFYLIIIFKYVPYRNSWLVTTNIINGGPIDWRNIYFRLRTFFIKYCFFGLWIVYLGPAIFFMNAIPLIYSVWNFDRVFQTAFIYILFMTLVLKMTGFYLRGSPLKEQETYVDFPYSLCFWLFNIVWPIIVSYVTIVFIFFSILFAWTEGLFQNFIIEKHLKNTIKIDQFFKIFIEIIKNNSYDISSLKLYQQNIYSLFNIFIDTKLCISEIFFFYNLLLFIFFIFYYYYFIFLMNPPYLTYLKPFKKQNSNLYTFLSSRYTKLNFIYANTRIFFFKFFIKDLFNYKVYINIFFYLLRYIFIIKKKLQIKFFIIQKYFFFYYWSNYIINNLIINFSIILHLITLYIYINCFSFNWYFLFNFQFENNMLIFLIKIFIILLSIIILYLFKNQLSSISIYNWEFFLIYNFSILSLLFIISCCDLIILFFCIELYSLCIYLLISFKQHSLYSTEAGLKYFIISSISATIFLFGVFLIYIQLGTTNFNDLFFIFFCEYNQLGFLETSKFLDYKLNGNYFDEFLMNFNYMKNTKQINMDNFINYNFKVFSFFNFYFLNNIIIICAFILISISLFFKLTIAPFHLWIIDVYEGAPILIMFFLNIIPKIVFYFILFKLYYYIFYIFVQNLTNLFLILIIISFCIGSIGGIYQLKIKRLLVYSMIYNNGYFILALINPSLFDIVALFYFLCIYILNLLGFFICFLNLRSAITNKQCTNIFSLTNLWRINPVLASSFIFIIFSLSGIPPFIGFFSKFYLLYNNFHNIFLIWVSFFTSIINIFYYIRLIKIMCFIKTYINFFFKNLSFSLGIILFFILINLFILIIEPMLFFNLIKFYLLLYYKY